MFHLLLDDPDVVAVHKPEGMASIPEKKGDEACLQALLSTQLQTRLYAVHRLDKEASGVILFARSAPAHQCLNDQFAARAIRKTYRLLTHGVLPQDSGLIDQPLREFGSGRMGVDPQGKPSATEFSVLRRFANTTLVEAFPLTGRRHQLRAHFYSVGHPLAGDLRYGDRTLQQHFPRLMLHALRITFHHPDGRSITVEAPEPESFTSIVQSLAAGA